MTQQLYNELLSYCNIYSVHTTYNQYMLQGLQKHILKKNQLHSITRQLHSFLGPLKDRVNNSFHLKVFSDVGMKRALATIQKDDVIGAMSGECSQQMNFTSLSIVTQRPCITEVLLTSGASAG